MKILLTGATGYIGSGVLRALLDAGHHVTALVRDPATVERAHRVTVKTGDMRDRATARDLAANADAVIATALPGDATSAAADTEFADAVLDGLRPGATFVRTGGIWVHGSGADLTEESPVRPPDLVAWRGPLDGRILAAPGIRPILIEPGVVFGHGRGIPALVAGAASSGDALRLIGPGTQHWSMVHVDDLAELYVAALERGAAGARYLGVDGAPATTGQLGEAASHRRGLGGRVVPEDPADTVARLGAFGAALLLDQRATGAKARAELSWKPRRATLLEEIAAGGYDAVTG